MYINIQIILDKMVLYYEEIRSKVADVFSFWEMHSYQSDHQ